LEFNGELSHISEQMKKLKHINLFKYGGKKEVYQTLQDHYDRDTWIHMWWHYVLLACALGAAFISDHMDWLWIFGGLYAVERAIARYIDNSNRNWFMHSIDWKESGWSESDEE